MDLGSNLFSGIAPFSVVEWTNMSYFNVSYNGFEGQIQGVQTCSEKLEVFDVAGSTVSKGRFL